MQVQVAANGLRFDVETAGEGDDLVLLLHGFPETALAWRAQISALAAEGYRVWAPSQRGYSAGARPAGIAAYRLEHLLGDVAALIDAARARRVTLVGHDWGGAVAWLFAMRRVRPLERLVVLNCPHPAVLLARLRGTQALRSWYVLFFQLPWLPEMLMRAGRGHATTELLRRTARDPSCFAPETLHAYRRLVTEPGAATAMLNWYRAAVRGGGLPAQTRVGFPRIDVPTLLIWGDRDVALGLETTRGTERYVRDCTLRVLPGVSHWVQHEAPGVVNAMLAAFLAGAPVPEV